MRDSFLPALPVLPVVVDILGNEADDCRIKLAKIGKCFGMED